MRKPEILAKLSAVFRKAIEINRFDEGMAMENTQEWDSLKHLQLIAAIEDAFGIEIDFEDAVQMTSVKAILRTIGKYVSAKK